MAVRTLFFRAVEMLLFLFDSFRFRYIAQALCSVPVFVLPVLRLTSVRIHGCDPKQTAFLCFVFTQMRSTVFLVRNLRYNLFGLSSESSR